MIDYFEGALPPAKERQVRRHLDACVSCRKIFFESGAVMRLAASKIPPKPDAAFWKDFDASLSQKLDALAGKKEKAGARPAFGFNLRPALVMAPLAIVVVALGIRILPLSLFPRAINEADLVDEAVLLDEMSSNGDNKDLSLDGILEDAALLNEADASQG
jgi:hypothetical protein